MARRRARGRSKRRTASTRHGHRSTASPGSAEELKVTPCFHVWSVPIVSLSSDETPATPASASVLVSHGPRPSPHRRDGRRGSRVFQSRPLSRSQVKARRVTLLRQSVACADAHRPAHAFAPSADGLPCACASLCAWPWPRASASLCACAPAGARPGSTAASTTASAQPTSAAATQNARW